MASHEYVASPKFVVSPGYVASLEYVASPGYTSRIQKSPGHAPRSRSRSGTDLSRFMYSASQSTHTNH